jgi:hypothetical protein
VLFDYKNHLGMVDPDLPPALDLQGEMIVSNLLFHCFVTTLKNVD